MILFTNLLHLQVDTETIELDHHTKKRHHRHVLVSESIANLQQLVEHMNSRLRWLEPSVDELCRLVADFTNDIHWFKVARRQVRVCRDGEESGDRNEEHGSGSSSNHENEESVSEGKLQILLDIEERLEILQGSENCLQLWKEISAAVGCRCLSMQSQWLQGERRVHAMTDLANRLQLMWEHKDSVWLLGFDWWATEQVWFGHVILDIIQQIYLTVNHTEQHPQKETNREQLLMTFQERLKQWKVRSDSLQRQRRKLKDMLESWPQHSEVREICFWNRHDVCDTLCTMNWNIMSRVYTSPSGWFYAAMFCYLPSPVQVAFCIFLKSEVEWLFFIK